jgi:hypothetical protein
MQMFSDPESWRRWEDVDLGRAEVSMREQNTTRHARPALGLGKVSPLSYLGRSSVMGAALSGFGLHASLHSNSHSILWCGINMRVVHIRAGHRGRHPAAWVS